MLSLCCSLSCSSKRLLCFFVRSDLAPSTVSRLRTACSSDLDKGSMKQTHSMQNKMNIEQVSFVCGHGPVLLPSKDTKDMMLMFTHLDADMSKKFSARVHGIAVHVWRAPERLKLLLQLYSSNLTQLMSREVLPFHAIQLIPLFSERVTNGHFCTSCIVGHSMLYPCEVWMEQQRRERRFRHAV